MEKEKCNKISDYGDFLKTYWGVTESFLDDYAVSVSALSIYSLLKIR